MVGDIERTQYKILAGLEAVDEAFDSGRFYPYLTDLNSFAQSPDSVLERIFPAHVFSVTVEPAVGKTIFVGIEEGVVLVWNSISIHI